MSDAIRHSTDIKSSRKENVMEASGVRWPGDCQQYRQYNVTISPANSLFPFIGQFLMAENASRGLTLWRLMATLVVVPHR
jgi:hypothetical protein